QRRVIGGEVFGEAFQPRIEGVEVERFAHRRQDRDGSNNVERGDGERHRREDDGMRGQCRPRPPQRLAHPPHVFILRSRLWAAQPLAKGTLHAYAGTLETDLAKTAAVASLGGYVIARVDRDACAAVRGLKPALPAGAVWHPYPVTPFHADYLHHADRAEAARAGAAADKKQTKVQI